MGHTGIYAFGDCVRRMGLGQFATVVELRIPCVYAWGVSTIDNQFQVETSLFPLLRFATIIGFGFTLGILGAAEVVWILWALVQVAKGLL